MVEDEQSEVLAEAPVERKSRKPLVIVVAVLVLLALAAGGYFWMNRTGQTNTAKPVAVKLSKTELYLPLEPAFVVNFRDDESLRYLQVGVTLMSHDADALGVAKSADPVIRDALVALFSDQKYSIISDAPGRAKLQAQALTAVRTVVKARLGRPGIDALYFTSFVMQ